MTKTQSDPPAMSVVLVSAGGAESIRRTVRAMASQTVAERMEIILVTPDASARRALGPLLEIFHTVKAPPSGPIGDVDHANGRALSEATAPIIASVEDHAFPDADWAETILAAFDATDAVSVGSAMLNANPHAGLSWSNILLAYGQWSETTPEGPIDWVSHHNGTFRREALMRFDPEEYWRWFDREGTIMRKLAEAGGRFHFAPGARVRHINPSTLRATAQLRVDAGRLYAANRARDEGWGLPKRLIYALLSPAIPALRYLRLRREVFGDRTDVSETRRGPALLLGLLFDAAGQAAGFVTGPGGSRIRLAGFEMDRMAHLNAHDRAIFAPASPRSAIEEEQPA